MQKNTVSKIYGVLGYPAKHSLSPLMHNAAFKALKINAEYKIFEVAPADLEKFIRTLPEQNISGVNVTIPYKEKVIPFLDSISEEAKLIGAVNTIKVSEDRLEGFNTDGEGFLRDISEIFDFNPTDKTIAILGAGGASKAVSVYLAKTKPKKIAIYDIDKDKLAALIEHLKDCCRDTDFVAADSIEELGIRESDLLVNATPVGMKETDPSLVEEKFLHKDLLVYDLIYHVKETKLLKDARKKGCRTAGGLGMLLGQGIISFKIWTGKNPPKEIMKQALLKALPG
jgi:shikimate dehydrogenase